MVLNCGNGEESLESLVLQGNQACQSYRKWVLNIHWMDWCLSWSSNTLATWCRESTHWDRPWCWKNWRQGEKGMTEDKMVGWHHWLNEHEFEQAPGAGDEQGSLACFNPWGCKELDTTERRNRTDGSSIFSFLEDPPCFLCRGCTNLHSLTRSFLVLVS